MDSTVCFEQAAVAPLALPLHPFPLVSWNGLHTCIVSDKPTAQPPPFEAYALFRAFAWRRIRICCDMQCCWKGSVSLAGRIRADWTQ